MRESSDRALRVAALVKRELTRLLRDEVRDPGAAGAVISDVELSRDLSLAKVYLMLPGDTGGRAGVLAGLDRATGFLRAALADRLDLRAVPKLRFLDDDTERRSERIERLLAEEKRRGVKTRAKTSGAKDKGCFPA